MENKPMTTTYTVTTIIDGKAIVRTFRATPKNLANLDADTKICFYCKTPTDSDILGMFDEPVCEHCAAPKERPLQSAPPSSDD